MKKTKIQIISAILLMMAGLSLSFLPMDNAPGIDISNGVVKIDGHTVIPGYEIKSFVAALGDPSIKRHNANAWIHIYDSKGLVVWEGVKDSIGNGKVSQFEIYFSLKYANKLLAPLSTYVGKFTIDKAEITGTLSKEDLKTKLPDWDVRKHPDGSYTFKKGDITLYVEFSIQEDYILSIGI